MIKEILQHVEHRPWDLPKDRWKYYQEWNRLLFFHFEVPFDVLRALVPKALELDSFEGKYYISVVPFTMEKIRPRMLPSVGFVSNFDELNVRTYVVKEGKAGVYFLTIEGGKSLSVFVSKQLSGLPYEKATMKRSKGVYTSSNPKKPFQFEATYAIGNLVQQKNPLQVWLTERYCLYVYVKNKLYRYQIHHKVWELKEIEFDQLKIAYDLPGIQLTEKEVIAPNYSDGIQVVAWGKEKVE
ncbi:YqjF family protein [Myroides sp. C15-4]|uniref:YqjF family protein n=1 Tax=Myroides sp. C15-4 TaxID=3400532 RepID=UPI003D2F62DE